MGKYVLVLVLGIVVEVDIVVDSDIVVVGEEGNY